MENTKNAKLKIFLKTIWNPAIEDKVVFEGKNDRVKNIQLGHVLLEKNDDWIPKNDVDWNPSLEDIFTLCNALHFNVNIQNIKDSWLVTFYYRDNLKLFTLAEDLNLNIAMLLNIINFMEKFQEVTDIGKLLNSYKRQ